MGFGITKDASSIIQELCGSLGKQEIPVWDKKEKATEKDRGNRKRSLIQTEKAREFGIWQCLLVCVERTIKFVSSTTRPVIKSNCFLVSKLHNFQWLISEYPIVAFLSFAFGPFFKGSP